MTPHTAPPRPASAEVPVHGERALRTADRWLTRLDSTTGRALPKALNPLLQLGALANACFLIAVVTGVLLLIWYVPSVHEAYDSMVAIGEQRWTANLVRTLHRYSSDACMLLALLHAVKIIAARRFTGARWLAWVTGIAVLGMLWLIGWLGYWLVWDQPAQLVAQGSARMLDVLPIFADPLERSFLTDGSTNSLLFFLVFFAHMLLPLAMAIGLWLHIARLARARFLPGKTMWLWATGSLVAVSLLFPAGAGERAEMTTVPGAMEMDWWYLAPLQLTDRLGGGALWLTVLVGGTVLLTVPWWMARGRLKVAEVQVSRCNSCQRCFHDCPYDAISMVPRTDGKTFPFHAQVDPAKCIGCGICSGSCDSVGIGLDWFDVVDQRQKLDRWLAEDEDAGIAFVCAHSAGGRLTVDADSGRCEELPGHRVLEMPCAGWLHMLTVERVQRRGAKGVVVVACGDGDCRYREGDRWTEQRLDGAREPVLRADKADRSGVTLLRMDPTRRDELVRAVRGTGGTPGPRRRSWLGRAAAAAALVLGLLAATVAGSDLGYTPPLDPGPQLVVSFKHAGTVDEVVHVLTEEEKAALPSHQRRDRIVERSRNPVRMRVHVDGDLVLERSYDPQGLWDDGNSIAIERLPVEAGTHEVVVEIGETADPGEWTHRAASELEFTAGKRRVVLFDRVEGFNWY